MLFEVVSGTEILDVVENLESIVLLTVENELFIRGNELNEIEEEGVDNILFETTAYAVDDVRIDAKFFAVIDDVIFPNDLVSTIVEEKAIELVLNVNDELGIAFNTDNADNPTDFFKAVGTAGDCVAVTDIDAVDGKRDETIADPGKEEAIEFELVMEMVIVVVLVGFAVAVTPVENVDELMVPA